MNSFILKGNICYSISKTELKTVSGYVVCMDGKCAGVFEKFPEKYKDLEFRDLKDKLIIPGMVDLHIHAPQYAFRGMGMDYELRPDSAFYGDSYDKHDLFGDENLDSEKVNTVMAHCVWSSDEEVKLMRENGVFIAHCPASNINLTSGIAPVRKYLDLDMKIGLGSDVAGGQTESIFRAITDAIGVSKMYLRYVDEYANAVTFEEAFYMATKGGGEFFGKVGSFEEGYEFDALVLDDSILAHPLELNLRQRIERSVYLSLDMCGGIKEKYIQGNKVI